MLKNAYIIYIYINLIGITRINRSINKNVFSVNLKQGLPAETFEKFT